MTAGDLWGQALCGAAAEGEPGDDLEAIRAAGRRAPDLSRLSPEESHQPPVFELLTMKQRRVIWGHPPDSQSHEPSTAKKLERLASYIKKQSSLDQPPGNLAINIRLLSGVKLMTIDGSSQIRQSRQNLEPR